MIPQADPQIRKQLPQATQAAATQTPCRSAPRRRRASSAPDPMRCRKCAAGAERTAARRRGRPVQPSDRRRYRRHASNRPGYMLDDAQIASIKERLHLTPDQEQMWPAVEAALRNIAYTRVQDALPPRRASNGTHGRRGRSRRGARSQIRGRSADHELQRRAKRRSAQHRPRHGTRSARIAVLISWSASEIARRSHRFTR